MKTKTITSIAVEKAGKFLLLKRARHDTYPGIWEFPSGKVNKGEELEDCARRELLEETGLKARKLEYRGRRERVNKDVLTIVNYFYVSSFSGKIKLSTEHEGFMWTSEEEILSLRRVKDSDKKHGNYEGRIGTDAVNFFRLESARKS